MTPPERMYCADCWVGWREHETWTGRCWNCLVGTEPITRDQAQAFWVDPRWAAERRA